MKLFKKIWTLLIPPPKWRLSVIIILGVFVGLGVVALRISNATSYLSDDPEACINCHVMIPQYATWKNSSHGRVATCNDCHVPQDNIFSKYAFKAGDGLRHSYMFTFRLEPQVIQATQSAKEAIQENCQRCHANLIHNVTLNQVTGMNSDELLCWDCHRDTPHGKVRSLSATPFAQVPQLSPVVPAWIEDSILDKSEEN